MDEFRNTNGYSFSWTQPYHIWPALFNPELAVIEAIDRLVESGLTHPEADRILKKLMKENRHD